MVGRKISFAKLCAKVTTRVGRKISFAKLCAKVTTRRGRKISFAKFCDKITTRVGIFVKLCATILTTRVGRNVVNHFLRNVKTLKCRELR